MLKVVPLVDALRHTDYESGGFGKVVSEAKLIRECRGKIFFIGNGGSAAIASHMANDWFNKGRFDARCFNDPAALTCIANDFGYSEVFFGPMARYSGPNTMLFAISSSGKSQNIIRAVDLAKSNMTEVVTLSGFEHDNLLRSMGHINFYVPSNNYGVVETAHLWILHALLEAVSE